MVRFKPPYYICDALLALLFQFHDGSIQAVDLIGCSSPGFTFQFHDGSIQAALDSDDRRGRIIVSIPRWFDSSAGSRGGI